MSIPKKQKLAMALIVVVGAAAIGATLLTGRHRGAEGHASAESASSEKTPSKKEEAPDVKAVASNGAEREGSSEKDERKNGKAESDEKAGEEKNGEKGEQKSEKAAEAQKIVLNPEAQRAAGVTVGVAGPGKVATVLQLPGEIQFNQDRTAHVVPRVAGVVQRVLVNLGQHVRRGDVLALIASATISDQRSDLLTAQKRLRFAESTFAREKKLWEEKISAEQDYLQAKQAMEESRLAVANAGQKLGAIGATASANELGQFAIRAPFDGTVVEKRIVLGDAIKDDAAVFTIADLQTVWVDVVISPTDLNNIRVGTKVVVHGTGTGTSATGTVSNVGAFLGEQSRTAHARVTLANPGGVWRPGMFATVDVANGETLAPITVAADAVQLLENAPHVFLETAGGFIPRPVKVGRTTAALVEIVQGLHAGDRYAATGSFVLKADLGKANAKSDD